MASNVSVVIKSTGGAQVTAEIKGIGDAAEKSSGPLSGLHSSLSKVSQIAGGFVLGQGILKAPGFLMDAAKAAAEDEASTARLDATIKNLVTSEGVLADSEVPDAIAGVKAQFDAAITAGQKLAFSDDEVRDSLGALTNATGSSREALSRHKIAMDLARGGNIDLATASKLLGKVTDENLQVLRKMGITLPDVASEADVLAAIQKKFAGQSEAYAQSTAGQFQQAQIAMSEIKESIGAALLPVITKLTTVLAEQLPVIQALAAEYSAKAAPAIAAVGVVLGPLIEQIGGSKTLLAAAAVVIGGVVVAAFTAWAISAASAAVATIAAAAPVLAVVAALALLTLAIYLIIDNWDEITANYPAVGRAFDDIKVSIQGVVDYVTENWDQIMSTIEPALIALVAVVEYQWEQIKVGIDAALKIIGGYLDIWIGLFTGDWERMWEGVKGVLGGAVDAITSSIGNAFDLVNELTGGKLGEFTSTVSSALSDAAGAVRSFYDDAVQPIQWLIDRFWQLIHAIQSIPTPSIGGFSLNPFDHFATGTSFAPGGLAVVGENGPELVNLPRGAQVFTNAESRQMAGGGGVTIHIEHLYARDESEARQAAGFLGYAVQSQMASRGLTAVRA